MGKLYRMIAVTCVLTGACSRPTPNEQAAAGEAREDRKRARAAVVPEPPDARFDAAGKLTKGTLRADWFELPSGFQELPGATKQLRTYEASRVPIAKAREYINERVVVDRAEYLVNGVLYPQAQPANTQLVMTPLTISVFEVDRQRQTLRLIVEDRSPPADAKPLMPEVAAQVLLRERNKLE